MALDFLSACSPNGASANRTPCCLSLLQVLAGPRAGVAEEPEAFRVGMVTTLEIGQPYRRCPRQETMAMAHRSLTTHVFAPNTSRPIQA